MKPLVSIILVSYNTAEYTLRALESVQKQTQSAYELIVVDNHSTDQSVELIRDRFPTIQLIESAEKVPIQIQNQSCGVVT